MKVVLDTNVLISAFFWRGKPHKLLKLAEKGDITICLTFNILKELSNVLKRDKFSTIIENRLTSREGLLAGILEIAELRVDRKIAPVVKKDPDDDKILSCAKYSSAKYIITGDPHLLNLKTYSGIPIINPNQFLKIFNKSTKL